MSDKTPDKDLRAESADPAAGWASDRISDKDLRATRASVAQLRTRYEKAEQHAQKLMAEKDAALGKTRDRYASRLQEANDKAAAAQKALNDAEVIESLKDRPDGDRVAASLGITLND